MKQKIFRSLTIVVALVCSLTVYLFGALANKTLSPDALPTTTITTEIDTVMQTVSILDVTDCHKVTALNIVQNDYAKNIRPEGVTYTHGELGNRGTIHILVTNLDPMAENYTEQAEKLEWLKGTDENYHLTLYLPPIRSAVVVYMRAQLVGTAGELKGYDFVEFYNRSEVTENHVSQTEPLFLDLTLFSNRKFLGVDAPLNNGVLVTLHYETTAGKSASIDGDILLGEDSAVRAYVKRNNNAIYIAQIVAISMFAVFTFVSLLKRKTEFLPQFLFLLGITGVCICTYVYTGACASPSLLLAFRALCVGVLTLGAALSVNYKYKKFPFKAVTGAIAFLSACLAFFAPLSAIQTEQALLLCVKILNSVLILGVPVLLTLDALRGNKWELSLSSAVAIILTGLATFGNYRLTVISPLYFLGVALLAVTVYVGFREFVLTERHNAYLTNNLQAEVARQTDNLTKMMNERDNLLRYLSHDLRKPIIRIRENLPLVADKDEHTQASALANVNAKLDSIDYSLLEVSKYSKTNYNVEVSQTANAGEILQKLYADLNPDCEANSVRFKVSKANFNVFVKKNALNSILQNLVLNALDHSLCTQIEVSATKNKNKQCVIEVQDNGIGVSDERTLFQPYATGEEDGNNFGIGLYIARQFAQSMGGDLTYRREENNSIFAITIPLV